ncbi:MAG: hypothetical protein AW07_04729 [Candidatus Accumulibacter sp. SK-11]|nr:MAG: hypothetical protein AW07_04729 [Candidatus Accumulibacter sp. SK-11]
MIDSTTASPGAASPPTVPVTGTIPAASLAVKRSSAVMLSTVMVAEAVRSTVCSDRAVPTKGLPASSKPLTEARKRVSTARSAPETSMLKVFPGSTEPT